MPPCVIHALDPVIVYPSGPDTALQASAAASLPAWGSDRLYAPIVLPPSISGSHRCFCSSVPKVNRGWQDSPCTLTATATAAHRAASSSSTCR